MKAPIARIMVTRFVRERGRQSKTVKSWTSAEDQLEAWLQDGTTLSNSSNTFLVRPRWSNGLALSEIGLSVVEMRDIPVLALAPFVRKALTEAYGSPEKKRLQSAKACVARLVLSSCSFTDAAEEDISDDARTFDATSRALKTCFPDHAETYIERVRSWMVLGGGVR